ncbi:uncharacterized protein FPRO_11576 [Fusarium proliferatum ET1]|uniref:Uncharacterized protein n=1 Tax=Fusarium proliferatum (strain ET1) TaxID=1227346 RepID=A0A1L7W0E4_FUSPR|nr:uncharacterized protein FPRO_11576 [Fusarium proliferatum ET1]CZR46129.1 uncharacterized protein FPRO_11576 [Fusarium proliferatum ET1]
MSEIPDPAHALPAPYLIYKNQLSDDQNRPLDKLWNEMFRKEYPKWGHLRSEADKAEWVYWANHLRTAKSTDKCYNRQLGKAGTDGNRRMSWEYIYATIAKGGKGKGWAGRAAAAYPNASIWRGQLNEDAEEATLAERPTQVTKKVQGARHKAQFMKTKPGKGNAKTRENPFGAFMRKSQKFKTTKKRLKNATKSLHTEIKSISY